MTATPARPDGAGAEMMPAEWFEQFKAGFPGASRADLEYVLNTYPVLLELAAGAAAERARLEGESTRLRARLDERSRMYHRFAHGKHDRSECSHLVCQDDRAALAGEAGA